MKTPIETAVENAIKKWGESQARAAPRTSGYTAYGHCIADLRGILRDTGDSTVKNDHDLGPLRRKKIKHDLKRAREVNYDEL